MDRKWVWKAHNKKWISDLRRESVLYLPGVQCMQTRLLLRTPGEGLLASCLLCHLISKVSPTGLSSFLVQNCYPMYQLWLTCSDAAWVPWMMCTVVSLWTGGKIGFHTSHPIKNVQNNSSKFHVQTAKAKSGEIILYLKKHQKYCFPVLLLLFPWSRCFYFLASILVLPVPISSLRLFIYQHLLHLSYKFGDLEHLFYVTIKTIANLWDMQV